MTYLTGGTDRIAIPVSESASVTVTPSPLAFESRITCKPVERVIPQIEDTDDDDEEEDESANGIGEGSL
jgi:hypothetical protein